MKVQPVGPVAISAVCSGNKGLNTRHEFAEPRFLSSFMYAWWESEPLTNP